MELPPPQQPPPTFELDPDLAWHDTEFRHHLAYLGRFPHGAVTEGTICPSRSGSGSGSGSGFPPSFGESGRSVSDTTGTVWTDTEKLAFFGALARRSRWRPDLMADDIGGSKTQREVVEYLAALERERRIVKVFQRPRRVPGMSARRQGWVNGLAPAARELSAARIEWEEKCAEKFRCGGTDEEPTVAETLPARDESLRAFEAVAATHRKEAHELVKQFRPDDGDDAHQRAMRPRRMDILRRAKVALDRALERAKADRAAHIVEGVLRACDANGLKVMDVLVRQSAETTAPPPGPGPSHASPPPPHPIDTTTSRPQQRTIPSTRERQERERYAYLARFPVRRLDERHKAEKQMLAKRIRRREVRARKRVEGEAAEAGGEDGAGGAGESSTEATADTARVETGGPLQDSGAASVHAKPSNLPSDMPRTTTSSTTLTALLPDDPHRAALPLDLTSHRTHRSDTLAKHATKIVQEQYEKARAAYLARIPRDQLTAEQKHEKRTLGQRVRARERYRAIAAAKVGLKVEELGMHMVDAPTADVRLLVLSERKRRRSTGQSRDGPAAEREGQAQRHQRYAEEEDEYERMLAMPAESLSKEDRDTMLKLGSRIRSREWRRAQSTRVMTTGLKRERTVEMDADAAQGAEDAGEMANLPSAADSIQASTTINNVQKPVVVLELRQTQTSASCKNQAIAAEAPDGTPETAEPIKRKRGRPPKTPAAVQSAETVEPIKRKRGRPPKTAVPAQSIDSTTTAAPAHVKPSEQRTRRANQYDDLGIGKTRFAQELKAYHDSIALEFVSFCNLCDRELEEEFSLLLRVNAKAVESLLKESRYAPQLYAFAQGRRLDLLDLQGMAKLLSRAAKGEEGRTVDLTQLMASLGSMDSLIRRTIELCSEITADPRLPDSAPAMVDQDSMLLSLSLLGQRSTQKTSREEKAAASNADSPLPTRIPDAEWVDLVNPDDGLFEQDPMAEIDAETEIDELRLLEVEEQQAALDRLEDEEYESRLETAIRHPEAVVMLDSALPVLENDIFDWTMYERDKNGRWRDAQKQMLQQSLPETWTKGISDEMPASTAAAREERVKRINGLRHVLQSTIYHQDRMRWQRIKRLRDPMYRYGGVPRPSNTYKSAAYIDTTDEGDSETETEEEGEIERDSTAVDHDPFEKEDELERSTGFCDHAPSDKEDELEGENEFEDYDSFEKEDELMEEHD
ncbi:hypothetical protein NliqN6_4647 [Naganishia liquefaciens]|uniref:Uncharacterized protein n=1 Tax=Naganishia liquefaciens TaxID=104408 RepID=A0A8H3TWU0_9TREE|nr:hypothetical protein NliqN6_4647 [Naganishia liquefaciens]